MYLKVFTGSSRDFDQNGSLLSQVLRNRMQQLSRKFIYGGAAEVGFMFSQHIGILARVGISKYGHEL